MSPVPSTHSLQKRLGDFALDQAPLGGADSRPFMPPAILQRKAMAGRGAWRCAFLMHRTKRRERLLDDELRVVRTLKHAGIAKEFGVIEAEGYLFAVMELVEG